MRKRTSEFYLFIFLAGALLSTSACKSRELIRVGFVAGLTGPNAALGVDGRDGALLAVNQINARGGIHGRRIELVTRDDLGTAEGAIAADRDLIENEEIFAIIGHMTSVTMIAAWGVFQDSGAIFLSPTVSTPRLAGLDDNFLRLIVVNSHVAKQVALYAATDLRLKRMIVFYDVDNAAFTQTYQQDFSNAFTANGGEILLVHEFSSKAEPNFRSVLHQAKDLNPDGLFLAASAFDTALIAQQAKLEGLNIPLFATNWSFTSDLIQKGGTAVEGISAVVSHSEGNQTKEYLTFESQFVERYRRTPAFGASYGYETMLVLASALEQTGGEMQGLKSALLKTNIMGINGSITFDSYGDVSRPLYLITVQDGKFITARVFPAP